MPVDRFLPLFILNPHLRVQIHTLYGFLRRAQSHWSHHWFHLAVSLSIMTSPTADSSSLPHSLCPSLLLPGITLPSKIIAHKSYAVGSASREPNLTHLIFPLKIYVKHAFLSLSILLCIMEIQ